MRIVIFNKNYFIVNILKIDIFKLKTKKFRILISTISAYSKILLIKKILSLIIEIIEMVNTLNAA
jgi:hypothetical protein